MVVEIKVENFIQKVQTTKHGRMPTYFKEGTKIPKKYTDDPNFVFKKGKLYNVLMKGFVIKNESTLTKPRFTSVSGNEIYSGLNEHTRIKIVSALKSQMVPAINKSVTKLSEVRFPWSISLVVKKPFGYANWDADNLWMYFKTFQDSLVGEGVIPDDNVRIIRDTGRIRFEPCTESETTTLTYSIQHDPYTYELDAKPLTFEITKDGKPGDMFVINDVVQINTGKSKILWPAAKKAIRRAMFHCINNFKWVDVQPEERKVYKEFFDEFKYYNIPLSHDERRILQEKSSIQ